MNTRRHPANHKLSNPATTYRDGKSIGTDPRTPDPYLLLFSSFSLSIPASALKTVMLKLLTPTARATSLRALPKMASVAVPKRSLFDNAGVPQPPGYIKGTVNDAQPVPKADRFHGSYHWTYERIITVGLVPLTVWPFITGSLPPMADTALGVLLVAHCQSGFGSCITDYIPKRRFPKLHPASFYLLYAGSAVALYGIYRLETEEEGLVGAAKALWEA